MKSVHLFVSGRVQGVGFRFYTERIANSLGLTGFVRNMANGDVEIVAEGDDKSLKEFITKVNQGPPLSRVLSIKEEWSEITNRRYKRFSITF